MNDTFLELVLIIQFIWLTYLTYKSTLANYDSSEEIMKKILTTKIPIVKEIPNINQNNQDESLGSPPQNRAEYIS